VFDLWVQAWRRKRAHGDMIVVRFADDIVLGFQVKTDADQFRAELADRMRKFNLELHPEKTRLLEFGPYAIDNRQRRGEGKPETFNFLGFTHICIKKRSNGMYTVLRQTIRKRLQAKLNEVKTEIRRRRHKPIPEQGQWLQAVAWTHPLLRRAHESTGAVAFSLPGGVALASFAVATKPERPLSLGPYAAPHHTLAADALCLSPLSPPSHGRHYLRQEPDAVAPLVRIRGGGCE